MKKNYKNKKVAAVIVASALVLSMLTGCGNKKAAVEEKTSEETSSEVVISEETASTESEVKKTEGLESATTPDSFGLKDFEGFYYLTSTEEMDGYDVTFTEGYEFNGDGTGKYYGQDTVDITWNETEIHFDSSACNYDMEPGKLTVHGETGDKVYEKTAGKFVKPNPYNVDVNNMTDGIFPACILEGAIKDSDSGMTLYSQIFTEDTYDIVDIGQMSEGDILYVDGSLMEVKSVDTNSYGTKLINGGLDEGGTDLRPVEESNCYVYFGYNDITSYTSQGFADFKVNADVKFIDNSEPSEEKVYSGKEVKDAVNEFVANHGLNEYNCKVMFENGEVTEINVVFIP